MAAQLRPNRMAVTDRFPMLSFTVRAGSAPCITELVLVTNPDLVWRKEGRTPATFYSSREHGLLSIARGEAVFMVPPEVLARFVGANRLWYGLASSSATQPAGASWTVDVRPDANSPYISLAGLSDRALRRVRMFPSNGGFGGRPPLLDWAGDATQPASTAVPASGAPAFRSATPQPAVPQPTINQTPQPSVANGDIHYDDGFGPLKPLTAAPPTPPGTATPVVPPPTAQTASGVTPAPVSQGLDADTDYRISEQRRSFSWPQPRKLTAIEQVALRAVMAINPATAAISALLPVAAPLGLSVAIGAAASAGTDAGVGGAVGLIFDPNGDIGVFAGAEIDVGAIFSASITGQLTLLHGHIADFNGSGFSASVMAGEEVVGGLTAIFNAAGNFVGVTISLGLGVGSPVSVYVGVSRAASTTVATSSSLAWARGLSDDPEAYGIDEPPYSEDDVSASDVPATASAMALGARENSLVTRTEASPNFDEGRGGKTIDRIVIHIADVPTVQQVVNTFTNASTKKSSHYLVGQDGEVVQFVSEADTAWHCKGSNQRSIGIEHIAVKRGGADYPRRNGTTQHFDAQAPSQIEYETSAALVASLCDKYSLPINRTTIMGHREADSSTGHTSCPDGNWDWEYFMRLVSSRTCQPQDISQSMGFARSLGQSFSVHWPGVPYIAQSTGGSCWAAATAMLVSWRDDVDISDRQIADRVGIAGAYAGGLAPENRPLVASAWNLADEPPASYGIEEFRNMLQSYGPLFLSLTNSRGEDGHTWLLVGITSDGADDGSDTVMYLHNPTRERGKIKKSFTDFLRLYENRVDTSGGVLPCQIMHAASIPAGKQPVAEPQFTVSTAMALGIRRQPDVSRASRVSRTLGADDWTINWDDVEMIPQPTDKSCWATAAAMVTGWRDNMSVDPTLLARYNGMDSSLNGGLAPADKRAFADAIGLVVHPNACYTPDGFRQILEANGPIWVTADVPGIHAIVVTGMYLQNGQYYVRITDPWDRVVGSPGAQGGYLDTHSTGSRYIMSWDAFTREFEAAGNVDRIQLLHSGGTFGHTINTGSAARVGYALGTEPPASGGEFGYGVTLTRNASSNGGCGYDLAQLTGLVLPANALAGGAGREKTSGPRITLDEWPYIDGPSGRISAPVAIDWDWQGGAVGNVVISPAQGQMRDGWTAQVRADISRATGTPERASLKLRIATCFRHAGEEDQVAVSEVLLNGDGRFQTTHGADSAPPSSISSERAEDRELQPA
jgi:N-acetyl-anhydromuramyl-L-alanine amidase AmpD